MKIKITAERWSKMAKNASRRATAWRIVDPTAMVDLPAEDGVLLCGQGYALTSFAFLLEPVDCGRNLGLLVKFGPGEWEVKVENLVTVHFWVLLLQEFQANGLVFFGLILVDFLS